MFFASMYSDHNLGYEFLNDISLSILYFSKYFSRNNLFLWLHLLPIKSTLRKNNFSQIVWGGIPKCVLARGPLMPEKIRVQYTFILSGTVKSGQEFQFAVLFH